MAVVFFRVNFPRDEYPRLLSSPKCRTTLLRLLPECCDQAHARKPHPPTRKPGLRYERQADRPNNRRADRQPASPTNRRVDIVCLSVWSARICLPGNMSDPLSNRRYLGPADFGLSSGLVVQISSPPLVQARPGRPFGCLRMGGGIRGGGKKRANTICVSLATERRGHSAAVADPAGGPVPRQLRRLHEPHWVCAPEPTAVD